ncbi:WD repeat-containing protein [Pyricularia oryzae 70-15]|uniref:WD repeat-containing protein n=2 Tax=Pyricularia oryzae TaxID=318829 RepID=G4NC74_PYRO7|nr:WD repeat-containing protein [Pyricularia oryzae 70-15]EHA48223.1 WD repeat-containing protein [Pyricularia oryzae 70-15]KAI7922091.1 WD repeat-containing protein [Pyricularia oryzae]KAI7926470.1 WD repeat-containing protein [Pyricularia oryzae]
MKAVLPGKPESTSQALSTGFWDSRRIIVYITGNAFAILSDHKTLLQTVYDDDESPLRAIAFDEASGKIATATDDWVRIYKPFGQEFDALKWALQSTFQPFGNTDDEATDSTPISLSWGASEELLVARAALKVYQTSDADPDCIWDKDLAGPVQCAEFSYDSAFIACCGRHDGLVKVWRRLSFGSDEVRFDFVYLRHPEPVTRIEWRRPHHVEQTMENVLYSFCADKVLRVWTPGDAHGGTSHLQLWGQLDLAEAIQGRESEIRWAFIIHGRDLSAAVETAVQEAGAEEDDMGLQHVVAVANKNPELCVVMDARGCLTAWALENVGGGKGASKKDSKVFNAAHVVSKEFDWMSILSLDEAQHRVAIYNFCNKPGGHMSILIHDFRGTISVYEANVADMLIQRPTNSDRQRLRLRGIWSGHSAPIRKIVRDISGRAIVSRTRDGGCNVWKHKLGARETSLELLAMAADMGHMHRICVLRKGQFVVFLRADSIALWDCRTSTSPMVLAKTGYTVQGKPLCLVSLPKQQNGAAGVVHIATITAEKKGVVWEFRLPESAKESERGNNATINGHGRTSASIREFCRFDLEGTDDLAYVLPVDPAGSLPTISGFLDVFARDVAVSYTHQGRVDFLTARVDTNNSQVEWLTTCSMETGLQNPSLVSGSTLKRAALVNAGRSSLTIWDIRGARLEYAQDFEEGGVINDLDWALTPDKQSVLAVGFPHRVVLLSEMRFDYLNKGPAWAPIREIAIREMTPHPIGDSTWLGDGHLVIGAGNQLFVHDRQYDVAAAAAGSTLVEGLRLERLHGKGASSRWDLFDVVQRLNGPLPVFHPQFLSQCMLAGRTGLLRKILLALWKTLKYWVEGEVVDDYLGLDMEEFYGGGGGGGNTEGGSRQDSGGFMSSSQDVDVDGEAFDEELAQKISEKLTRVDLTQLSGHEQIQLVDIVECAGLVESQRRSMDENGARFVLSLRQHALRKGRTSEVHMGWREINWAYHSESQDILVDFVERQNHGSLRWEGARESGMFMWLGDIGAVRRQFEVIARNEYTKSDLKNPVDCSLYYLALRKKTVLQGLWRMASWNREQKATQKLLANNFEDPKWRTTALKNAYALMSKRRFEYAAAFFLLADHLHDAVNVCLNQLRDMQLAIAVARVYEGDGGPVLRRLLEEEVLAAAAREGNRWLASWAFWMLKRRDMAVRALITPVFNLLETPADPSDLLKSKLFLTDDPSLIVLYAQLRQRSLQTLRGASKVTPRVEWEFVLHNARLYDRMGCDLLGLDLVRNWEFLKQPTETAASKGGQLGGEVNPLNLLRRRSSLVVADLPMLGGPLSPTAVAGGKKGVGKDGNGAAPTVFEEPDANSLLDSFGF